MPARWIVALATIASLVATTEASAAVGARVSGDTLRITGSAKAGPGNDFVSLGAGADTLRWDRGDGANVLEGGAGADRLLVNGSDGSEYLELAANGSRLRVIRDATDITVDADDVEAVEIDALGGADTIALSDLTRTDVASAAVDLEGTPGAGDGSIDGVIVNAGDTADTIAVNGTGRSAAVAGLATAISITRTEPTDVLTVNSAGGADTIDATGLAARVVALTLDGGAATDTLIGSPGADEFRWDPADGAESIEAAAGQDRLLVNGSAANDAIDVAANGARLRVARDAAGVADAEDLERVEVYPLAGADTLTTSDLTGTDVTVIAVELAAAVGGTAGDGQVDDVSVSSTGGADVVLVDQSGQNLVVTGLAAPLIAAHAEPTDRLAVNAAGGDDVVDATGLPAGAIALTLNGGDGEDVLTGGAGDDTINGGNDDDVMIGGPGVDTFDTQPGDIVIQD